jgi:hypothetical protein
MGGHVTGSVLEILDTEGDAGQRPGINARCHLGIHIGSTGAGPLGVNGHEGVERRVVRRDLPQRVLHQRSGRQLALSHLLGQLHDRLVPEVHDLDRTGET